MSNALPTESSGLPYPYTDQVDPDEQLKTKVLNALHWDPTVNASGLNIAAEGGRITISGVVKDAKQKMAAEANVRAVPEVVDVHNAIVVKE
jgi:osmotically-inducible protein OsmY